VTSSIDFENQAAIARLTCGWKKPQLPIEFVRRYWRDVHSPAIARRAGLWEYRHSQFAAVKSDLFAAVPGLGYACAADQQLMWLSDVRYADQAGLDAFGLSPGGEAKANLLADIELIVDQSSTYKSVGVDAHTLVDTTGNPTPQGAALPSSYAVFFRQHGDREKDLHQTVRGLAHRWAGMPGVMRLRMHIFEAPDMEAEKRGGYPIKTHPRELQYQAWIDLVLADDAVAKNLITPTDGTDYSSIGEVHAYPVDNLYTFNYGGRPTLVGLRGFCAYEAISKFDAANQRQAALLEWMFGAVATGGPVEGPAQ
jgi:hypothetical protein